MSALDFRATQIQTNQVIASGSNGTGASLVVYGIAGEAPGNAGVIAFNTGSIGTDIFFYVSGGLGTNRTVTGGDLVVSGGLLAKGGLSGSITRLVDGTSLIVAGTNITVVTGAAGNITISSTAAATGGEVSASYVVLSATSSLANERVLTAGPGIALTDGGAGGVLGVSASLLAGPNIAIAQVGNSYAISGTITSTQTPSGSTASFTLSTLFDTYRISGSNGVSIAITGSAVTASYSWQVIKWTNDSGSLVFVPPSGINVNNVSTASYQFPGSTNGGVNMWTITALTSATGLGDGLPSGLSYWIG